VGEDVGHCILTGEKYADVIRDILKMYHASPIQIDECVIA
jgi:hypothetical protein